MLFSTLPSLRTPPYVLQDKTPRNATGHGRREGKIPSFINIQVYPHEFSTEPIFIHSPAQMSSVRGCVYWDFILAYCVKEPIRV